MSEETEAQREYCSRTAEHYDAMHLCARDEHGKALGAFMGLAEVCGPVGSILDIGAGTGRAIEMLKGRWPRARVMGVEPVASLRHRDRRSPSRQDPGRGGQRNDADRPKGDHAFRQQQCRTGRRRGADRQICRQVARTLAGVRVSADTRQDVQVERGGRDFLQLLGLRLRRRARFPRDAAPPARLAGLRARVSFARSRAPPARGRRRRWRPAAGCAGSRTPGR